MGTHNTTSSGSRHAPVAWVRSVRQDLHGLGFLECKVMTGVFVHPVRDMGVVTHVEDFRVAGERDDLLWLRDEMSQKHELKVQMAGWEHGDEKELSFLGRTIRLGPEWGDYGRR